jgi:hypothetical protein
VVELAKIDMERFRTATKTILLWRIAYNALLHIKDKPQLIVQHFEVIQNYPRLLITGKLSALPLYSLLV